MAVKTRGHIVAIGLSRPLQGLPPRRVRGLHVHLLPRQQRAGRLINPTVSSAIPPAERYTGTAGVMWRRRTRA
jgi:hypothetical protein